MQFTGSYYHCYTVGGLLSLPAMLSHLFCRQFIHRYCNELPAVRRVDGVCVCAKEDEKRFDGTRSFDMYFERSLSRS